MLPMLPSEYLEDGWTKYQLARNDNGDAVSPTNESAISWCMTGAIRASLCNGGLPANLEEPLYMKIFNIIKNTDHASILIYDDHPSRAITFYNDHPACTHEEVIAIMQQAEQELGLHDVT